MADFQRPLEGDCSKATDGRQIAPGLPARHTLGAARLRQGEYALAVDALRKKWLRLRPAAPRAPLSLGVALGDSRRLPAATDAWQARIRHAPGTNVAAAAQSAIARSKQGSGNGRPSRAVRGLVTARDGVDGAGTEVRRHDSDPSFHRIRLPWQACCYVGTLIGGSYHRNGARKWLKPPAWTDRTSR